MRDYRTYRLTKADLAALTAASKVVQAQNVTATKPVLFPRDLVDGHEADDVLRHLWEVLAEKHHFEKASPAAHPDDLQSILAVPAIPRPR